MFSNTAKTSASDNFLPSVVCHPVFKFSKSILFLVKNSLASLRESNLTTTKSLFLKYKLSNAVFNCSSVKSSSRFSTKYFFADSNLRYAQR
jgi:hypothetical protein